DASTADDAAVYRLDDERALVATADFFTPIVDDPYDFGRIAAANALSDVYAVGARPLFALNLVGFPRRLLATEGLLSEILRGGGEIAAEAGVAVVGGHSVDDPEPKFGMCVIGEVHPDRIVRNSTARAGDVLVLTKAVGTGVITTAAKADAAPAAVLAGAVESMRTLNRAAAEAMVSVGAHAATDVTGYGLLGHLAEMMRGSATTARVSARAVPALAGALELIAAGHVPGGTVRNLRDLEPQVRWADDVPEERRTLLADAQTSGGLLIALARESVGDLLDALVDLGPAAAVVIGEVVERADVAVVVDRD
ncbi:MAG TPA: selenide, water dikinase SelD, partial [Candidatus Binatia bacterium]|nr:selenide, water dikinase SelD [Candidatus Binatia bacterium]